MAFLFISSATAESNEDCVKRVCGPPCAASTSACDNCNSIDVPIQCPGGAPTPSNPTGDPTK